MRLNSFSFFYALLVVAQLAATVVYADRFLISEPTRTCLFHNTNLTLGTCPTSRTAITTATTWSLSLDNPTQPSGSSIIRFRSSDDSSFAQCLGVSAVDSTTTQLQSCATVAAQAWTVEAYPQFAQGGWTRIMSSFKAGWCLGVGAGGMIEILDCGSGSSVLWSLPSVYSDRVSFYSSPNFQKLAETLFLGTYSGSTLPSNLQSLLSMPGGSIEIPPGFSIALTVQAGSSSSSTTTFSAGDVPYLTQIVFNGLSLVSVVVQIQSGVIVYDQADYLGANSFYPLGYAHQNASASESTTAGSVLFPTNGGMRLLLPGLTVYESVAVLPLTGTVLENVAVETIACSPGCPSSGTCNPLNGTCTCKPGFTGASCDQCKPGYFGPNCQSCPLACYGDYKQCDDGMAGTGQCRCEAGRKLSIASGGTLTCNACLEGYWGANCTACNCGHGSCDFVDGQCTCAAGWQFPANSTNSTNTANATCSECTPGRGLTADGQCASCGLGCLECNTNGQCLSCQPNWKLSPSNTCSLNSCADGETVVDNTCFGGCYQPNATCWGPNNGEAIKCPPGLFILDGYCVPYFASTGQCVPLEGESSGTWYGIQNTSVCEACPWPCLQCNSIALNANSSNSPTCTVCSQGYFLENGMCVKSCSNGFYDAGDGTCPACTPPCATCTRPLTLGAVTPCISCNVSTSLGFNGTCTTRSTCPNHFFASNGTCLPCFEDCLTCSGAGLEQCSSCIHGSSRPYLGPNGQCLEVCPKGMYGSTNGTCAACDLSCSTCYGPSSSQCMSCQDPTMVPSKGTCGYCSANTTLVQTERFCDMEAVTTTTPLTPGVWAAIVIGGLILIALIAVLIIHRRIVRRQRRLATEKFAENVGLRAARNDADRVSSGAQEMAVMAERTEQKLRGESTEQKLRDSGTTVEISTPEMSYISNNPFRTFVNNNLDSPITPTQQSARAWPGSEYMRSTGQQRDQGPEMIPMQRYGGAL